MQKQYDESGCLMLVLKMLHHFGKNNKSRETKTTISREAKIAFIDSILLDILEEIYPKTTIIIWDDMTLPLGNAEAMRQVLRSKL